MYHENIMQNKKELKQQLEKIESFIEDVSIDLKINCIDDSINKINNLIKANACINALILLSNMKDEEKKRYKLYHKLFKKIKKKNNELENKLKGDFDEIILFTFSFPSIELAVLLQLSSINEIMGAITRGCEEKIKKNKIKLIHFFIETKKMEEEFFKHEHEVILNKHKIETFIKKIILMNLQDTMSKEPNLPAKIGNMVEIVDKEVLKKENEGEFLNKIVSCLNSKHNIITRLFAPPLRYTVKKFYMIEEDKILKKLEKEELTTDNMQNNPWCRHVLCLARELKKENDKQREGTNNKKNLYIFVGIPSVLKFIVGVFEIIKEYLNIGTETIVYPAISGEIEPPIVPRLKYKPMIYKTSSDILRSSYIMYMDLDKYKRTDYYLASEVLRDSYIMDIFSYIKLTGCYLAHLFEPAFGLMDIIENINGPFCECRRQTIVIKKKCEKCGEEHWLFYCPYCAKEFELESDMAYLNSIFELFSKQDIIFMKSAYMFIQEYYEGKKSSDKDVTLPWLGKDAILSWCVRTKEKKEYMNKIWEMIKGEKDDWVQNVNNELKNFNNWFKKLF